MRSVADEDAAVLLPQAPAPLVRSALAGPADRNEDIGPMVKRGYSRAFTPKTDRRVMLTIDRIPPTLYASVKAKAKRDGISLRALILGWLKDWVER